jgi:hypothetical protein
MLAGRVWRDDELAASFDELFSEFASIISSIRQKFARGGYEPEQRFGSDQVVGVAGR